MTKNITRLLFIFAVSFGAVAAQENPAADQLSAEVVALYKAGKYAEAIAPAVEAAKLYAVKPGPDSLRYGAALRNLGLVEISAGKRREGVKTFRRAVEVYRGQASLDAGGKTELASMIETIAADEFNGADRAGAEKLFREALRLREEVGTADAADASTTLYALANLARYRDATAEAEDFARRSYAAGRKGKSASPVTATEAELLYTCMAARNGRADAAAAFIKSLSEADSARPVPADAKPRLVRGGVVNGKAVSLAKPRYPDNAREEGAVEVSVAIDEKGDVISACAFSGPKIFYINSEAAAFASKFSPTSIAGNPVKVTGVIVYSFKR